MLLGWMDTLEGNTRFSEKLVQGQRALDARSRDGRFSVADVFKPGIAPTSRSICLPPLTGYLGVDLHILSGTRLSRILKIGQWASGRRTEQSDILAGLLGRARPTIGTGQKSRTIFPDERPSFSKETISGRTTGHSNPGKQVGQIGQEIRAFQAL